MRLALSLILKSNKRKLQNNTLKNRCENSQQNISKYIPAIYEKDTISQSSGVHRKNARLVQHSKLKAIHHINRLKD